MREQAYADYHDVMDLTEELVAACSTAVLGTGDVTYQGSSISLKAPFRRATMHELVRDATGRSCCACAALCWAGLGCAAQAAVRHVSLWSMSRVAWHHKVGRVERILQAAQAPMVQEVAL